MKNKPYIKKKIKVVKDGYFGFTSHDCYCPYCNADLHGDEKYCPKCGKKFLRRQAMNDIERAIEVAIQALQEKAARENPKPLTLEQLKERMGKAVYITDDYNVAEGWYVVGSNDWYADGYGDLDAESLCGIMWKAYDHEPKEERK